MSENNKTTPKYIHYDSLSSTELENYLLMDLESDEEESLTIKDLYIITEILSKRNAQQSFHASEGWDSFKNDYLPYLEDNLEDKNSTPPKRNISITQRSSLHTFRYAAAIIICCFVGFSAYSVTTVAEGFFSQFANWSNETFWFGDPHLEEVDGSSDYIIDVTDYFDDVDFPHNFLPDKLPDNYLLIAEEGYKNTTEKAYIYSFITKNGDTKVNLKISYLYDGIELNIENNPDVISAIEQNGITYYFLEKMGSCSVIWCKDSFESTLSGNITKDEFLDIVESISAR